MGFKWFSSDSYDKTPAQIPPGNPDPSDYDVIKSEQIGECLIVKVRYPGCKNFEGVKILMYLGVNLHQLRSQKKIDPHFSDKEGFISPVARFIPTRAGMALARKLAKLINET